MLNTSTDFVKKANAKEAAESRLRVLQKRQTRLKAQIELMRSRASEIERKREVRRKILAGEWVLKEMSGGEWATVALWMREAGMLNQHDERLFDLTSKPTVVQ